MAPDKTVPLPSQDGAKLSRTKEDAKKPHSGPIEVWRIALVAVVISGVLACLAILLCKPSATGRRARSDAGSNDTGATIERDDAP